ncbi:MAG: hypothetical protein K2O16_03075 [Lachnospiraceae bacterium]|nr:hypothetical protein [Lachnospiraceae bacterium]
MIPFSKLTAPTIPDCLMHNMQEIKMTGGSYDMENGGQWRPGKEERETFKGVVLPVGDKDLIYIDAGAYTKTSRKIYTNGHRLQINGRVFDPQDGTTYVVKQELGYNSIHPLRRYLVDGKEGTAQK